MSARENNRSVQPELLDELPASDPRAVHSRADLRRLNVLMDHAGIMRAALRATGPRQGRCRITELGAGDGTFLLKLAHELKGEGVQADVTFVDQQSLVSAETRAGFAALDWNINVVQADVFEWLAGAPPADWTLANLFLHHFRDDLLGTLLGLAARNTRVFLACEPRRGRFALTAARLLGLIGCNAVTRHDAVVSIRAGFSGKELSALWPRDAGWELSENPAGLFSHCFRAQRLLQGP